MTAPTRIGRGDGVGIELTTSVARGVVLAAESADRLYAAAEVGIRQFDDDRSVLDALVRLHAELGGSVAPTRVALFPQGATLHRLDVTSLSGPELNTARHRIARFDDVSSTVLIDDGPRRWLVAVRWSDATVRRIEELVERAGFVDVAVDPSPIALSRVLAASTVLARRDAAAGESFDVLLAGVPIAATAIDPVGRRPPALATSSTPCSTEIFHGLTDPADLAAQLRIVADAADLRDDAPLDSLDVSLDLAGVAHPKYPPHDLRSGERQCVALGAALGAAGLAGRLRPIDMMLAATPVGVHERPWAIERVSTLPQAAPAKPISSTKRLAGRLIPRRKR